MQTESTLLELPVLTANGNLVKEIVIERLLKEKIISKTDAEEYCDRWQIIVIKNGWFKKWAKKFNKPVDDYVYKFVKIEDNNNPETIF
jgi:hypothetical protein